MVVEVRSLKWVSLAKIKMPADCILGSNGELFLAFSGFFRSPHSLTPGPLLQLQRQHQGKPSPLLFLAGSLLISFPTFKEDP